MVLTLSELPRTALSRKITSAALHVLEGLRVIPRGSFEVQKILNIAADSLVAAERLGIFTPMYYPRRANRVDPYSNRAPTQARCGLAATRAPLDVEQHL